MPADDRLRETELAADLAHLILEQLSQRLDEGELHVRLEPADVVMRLDRHRRAAMRRCGLDDVGIERPLHEELRVVARRRGRIFEDIDEGVADPSPLLLGIFDPRECRQKAVRCVDGDQLDPKMRTEGFFNLLALVQPEQSVIDEDAGQLRADRAMYEGCRDGRVDPAG